jgi:hypothetical protein
MVVFSRIAYFIYFQKILFVIPHFTASRHCHCQAGKPAREYNRTLVFTDTTDETVQQLG